MTPWSLNDSGSRGQSTHQSFMRWKCRPRSDSSLIVSSKLPTVSENEYYKVRKEIHCSLHEWHRDSSMLLDREVRVAHHIFVKPKYHPRPDSSLNSNSGYLIASDNEYHNVTKYTTWVTSRSLNDPGSRGRSGTPKFHETKISSEIWFQFKFQLWTPNSHGER